MIAAREHHSLAVVDAHCHIDSYADPQAVIEHTEALGIRTIAVTNSPSAFARTRELTRASRFVRPAAGLHPEAVHSHGHELELLWPLLDETRYVGEVGLDYVTTDPRDWAQQRRVFAAIVERCAAAGNKILTIHSRRAAADVIAIVGSGFRGRASLHWFSGSARELDQAAAAGFFFSVNPDMMVSKSDRALTARMPCERVLTETDGPYVSLAGHPAIPADVGAATQSLAELWGVSASEAGDCIAANLRRLEGESTSL